VTVTYVKVAVDAPLFQTLTYEWPENLENSDGPRKGVSVQVPLGRRSTTGIVLGIEAAPAPGTVPTHTIKPVAGDLTVDRAPLSLAMCRWLEWLAEYYVHPLGPVMSMAFPPLKRAKKKNQVAKKAPVVKSLSVVSAGGLENPPELTPEQRATLQSIGPLTDFQTHLVHGVTGSGKTEIYLQLLKQVLESGRRGLVLLPEISLTPQLVDRFTRRFGDTIAVIHSHLTPREKSNQWFDMEDGKKKILIGARSALFCPIEDLGLIVVDEEHEASYKQDDHLRYNARDAAIMLGKIRNIPVVLGSATPSLESWHNAKTGRYLYHELKHRVAERPLPTTAVVDLKEKKSQPFWLSQTLYESLKVTLEKKEQAALFLNRRGVAQTVMCRDCGFSHRCPNCDITLTLHGSRDLVCHYCDYAEIKKDICPHCKQGELASLGLGTESLENDLQRLFPEARISRADRDEIHSREQLEDLIRKMESREIDILVGTQMIAKGLDFPGLTLVGLVLADVGFNLPDFRSVERSFQLLTQVSGRSGRHSKDGGQVVIQTYNPDYPALLAALKKDFSAFAISELSVRESLHYPPFGRLASLRIQAADEALSAKTADLVAARASALVNHNPEKFSHISILGPTPAPLFKLRGQFRHHLLLKGAAGQTLGHFCRQLLGDQKWIPRSTKVQVDVDPIHLL
jgi:primosomal protein N' (replication factor Y) (superfamily II helicase)